MMGRLPSPGPVYAIADHGVLGGERLPKALRVLAAHGYPWIQLRAKQASGRELYRLIEQAVEALHGSQCALWLDDRADLASLFPVAGVHVGQKDLPAAAVKELLGEKVAVGQSTHDQRQVEEAVLDDAVDVIAVGPIFPTQSKENPDPVVGLELLRWARRQTEKPLVAIGGIDAVRLPRVLAEGADTVALLGALCRGDIEANCQRLAAAAKGWG